MMGNARRQAEPRLRRGGTGCVGVAPPWCRNLARQPRPAAVICAAIVRPGLAGSSWW